MLLMQAWLLESLCGALGMLRLKNTLENSASSHKERTILHKSLTTHTWVLVVLCSPAWLPKTKAPKHIDLGEEGPDTTVESILLAGSIRSSVVKRNIA